MNEEVFISLVQAYENLWDLRNAHYFNNLRRENGWLDISRAMKETPDACKQLWRKLRDGYRKAKKKRETKSGQAAAKIRLWKWEQQMSFLDTCLEDRDTISNIDADTPPSQEDSSRYDTMASSDVEMEDNIADTVVDTDSGGETTSPIKPTRSAPRFSAIPSTSRSRRKCSSKPVRGGEKPPSQVASALVDYLKEKSSKKKPENTEKNQIDTFFNAMAETVKILPAQFQVEVKSKIFNIINDYEMRALNTPTNSLQPTPAEIAYNATRADTDKDADVCKPKSKGQSGPRIIQIDTLYPGDSQYVDCPVTECTAETYFSL